MIQITRNNIIIFGLFLLAVIGASYLGVYLALTGHSPTTQDSTNISTKTTINATKPLDVDCFNANATGIGHDAHGNACNMDDAVRMAFHKKGIILYTDWAPGAYEHYQRSMHNGQP